MTLTEKGWLDQWGYIDRQGNEVVPVVYAGVARHVDGLAVVWQEEGEVSRYGCVDTAGQEVIPPAYDMLGTPFGGVIPVLTVEGWGLLDPKGNLVLPARYEYIGWESEGMIPVQLDGKMGFIAVQDLTFSELWKEWSP